MLTLRQWKCLLKYRIKSLLEYPQDIILGILGTILWHMPNFVLIEVIFQNAENISFSRGYLLLLYGISVFGDGVQHTFAESLWQFGNTHIKTAKYDEILIKPASGFMQVIASRFDIDGLGGVIWGIFCCFYGYALLGTMSIIGGIQICIAMLCAAFIFLSINILTSATAFFFYDNFYITHTIFELHKFSRFPREVYPRILTMLLTYFIPVFFATYYPINSVINGVFNELLYCLIGSAIFFRVSISIWSVCSKLYKSAGS